MAPRHTWAGPLLFVGVAAALVLAGLGVSWIGEPRTRIRGVVALATSIALFGWLLALGR